MVSPKKRDTNYGFTIIELVIVIVVIGILAVLVVTTYGGIQARARNNTRQADIQKLQPQLEAFFSQNGYYPSRANMNSPSWLAANMKGLDRGVLQDPSSSSKTLVATPTAKAYSYAVFQNDGTTSCETDDTTCAVYTLTATYEGSVNGSTAYTKSNL